MLIKFRASRQFKTAKATRQKINPFDTAAETIAGEFEDGFKWWFIVAQMMKVLAVVAELYLESTRNQLTFMLVIVSLCFAITFRLRPYEQFSDYALEVVLQLIQLGHLLVALFMLKNAVGKTGGGIAQITLLFLSLAITILALSEKWRIFTDKLEEMGSFLWESAPPSMIPASRSATTTEVLSTSRERCE